MIGLSIKRSAVVAGKSDDLVRDKNTSWIVTAVYGNVVPNVGVVLDAGKTTATARKRVIAASNYNISVNKNLKTKCIFITAVTFVFVVERQLKNF